MIIVGERRWRAAGIAGLETIPCVVVEGDASAEDLLEDQLVENCLRSDLRPVELARSYQALMAARGLSQRALAERLRVSPASVAKAVALLGLPGPIQESVDAGAIGPDVAYQLSKVEDPAEQAELAGRAVAGSIRRDELQARTRTAAPPRPGKGKGGPAAGLAPRPSRPGPGHRHRDRRRGDRGGPGRRPEGRPGRLPEGGRFAAKRGRLSPPRDHPATRPSRRLPP